MNNPYQQYVQQSVVTKTPVQLIIALYDKAVQELNKAIYFIEANEIEKAGNAILKTQDIVVALDNALKMKYDISENLAQLYDFFARQLLEANMTKDTKILKQLIPFFEELRDTFTEISKKGR